MPAGNPAMVKGHKGIGVRKGNQYTSTHRLQRSFLEAMQRAWENKGRGVIDRVIKYEPSTFLKIVASLMPKELKIDINMIDQLTDEQLLERLQEIRRLREQHGNGHQLARIDQRGTADRASPATPSREAETIDVLPERGTTEEEPVR